jgi:quercetin dioxygenase-like cupin family protein
MVNPLANPGEVIDIRALESAPTGITLVKTAAMEVKRLTLPKGREVPAHHAPGEITVQCLQGRVAFIAGAAMIDLGAGRMLFLDAGTPPFARRPRGFLPPGDEAHPRNRPLNPLGPFGTRMLGRV